MQNKLLTTKQIEMPFIARQFEVWSVPANVKEFSWSLGTKYEKVRYIVIGFQTKRQNDYNNAARFDDCGLESIYLHLNSEQYPNESILCDFFNLNAVQQYKFAKSASNSRLKKSGCYHN